MHLFVPEIMLLLWGNSILKPITLSYHYTFTIIKKILPNNFRKISKHGILPAGRLLTFCNFNIQLLTNQNASILENKTFQRWKKHFAEFLKVLSFTLVSHVEESISLSCNLPFKYRPLPGTNLIFLKRSTITWSLTEVPAI